MGGGRLGILAGSGDFPWLIIEHCRDTDRDFCVISFEDQTYHREFSDMSHGHFPIGMVGFIIDFLRGHDVTEIVMAGGIKRPNLRSLRMDRLGRRVMFRYLCYGLGDDRLLSIISEQLEKLTGAKIVGYEDLFGMLQWRLGNLSKHKARREDIIDMERAEEVFRCFSECDVGQSLIVQAGIVISVEAIEGTEALLQRSACLLRDKGRGFLFKKMKLGQSRKADLPTVGVDTIKQVEACGLQGLVIGQSGVIILDYDRFIEAADEAGLFVYVVE